MNEYPPEVLAAVKVIRERQDDLARRHYWTDAKIELYGSGRMCGSMNRKSRVSKRRFVDDAVAELVSFIVSDAPETGPTPHTDQQNAEMHAAINDLASAVPLESVLGSMTGGAK